MTSHSQHHHDCNHTIYINTLLLYVWSHVYGYKCKNEVRCRDDTVPKTVDTRRHCKVGLRACNNLLQPPKIKDVGRGLRKIVACSQSSSQCLLVSTVFGTVSSLHPTSFLMIFTLFLLIFSAISMANTHWARYYST